VLISEPSIVLKIADGKAFRNAMSALAVLVDEPTFLIDENCIRMREMDPSRVAMVDFEWPKSRFETFICKASAKISVNIGELLKILKRADEKESLEIAVRDVKARSKLEITIIGKTRRVFTLPTLEPSEEDVPMPKIVFNSRAKMTVQGFQSTLQDAELVSDHVRIQAEPEKVSLHAEGDLMTAHMELLKDKDSGVLLSLEAQETQKATFSLRYLSDILKAATLVADLVTVEFSSDMPLKLIFHGEPDSKLDYYLAPRIQEE
jgi:proliferating cell nuclear antigen